MAAKNMSWSLTVKPEGWAAAVAAVEAVGGQLLPIGKATKEKQILLRVRRQRTHD